jgi:hypothetical protein
LLLRSEIKTLPDQILGETESILYLALLRLTQLVMKRLDRCQVLLSFRVLSNRKLVSDRRQPIPPQIS